ncbi:MAG: DNA repair protein RecO [Bacteroidota bacterium]
MIVKTEAVVLKSRRYRETSKIVTVYSRKFGKISGIAKGARETKSKFGAALEPMTHVSLVIYKKEHRELHLISQSEIVRLFSHLHSDLAKITAGLSAVELINAAMHDEEANEMVFRLLLQVLGELDSATKNLQNVLYHFRLRLLDLMGFKPDFQTCARCRKRLVQGTSSEMPVHFDVQAGGILCKNCAVRLSRSVKLPFRTVKILQELQNGSLSESTSIEIPVASQMEIEETLKVYIKFHLAGVSRLKAEGMSKRLAV